MPTSRALDEAVVASWRTNNQVTVFFVENLPAGLWAQPVPGAPRRTVRMILGHLHNARLIARQTGHRLPQEITAGLWQWSKRAREVTRR